MEDKKLIVDLAQLFEDNGVKFKENSTGELIMDQCYNCGRSKKLYVSKELGLFTCFRCEEKGNAVKLVSKYLNISFKEAAKKLYGTEGKIYASPTKVQEEDDEPLVLSLGGLKSKKTASDLKLPEALKMPPELKILGPEHTEAYNYLTKRGYTPEDIENLNLLILNFPTFNDAWRAIDERLKKQGLKGEDLKNEVKKIARYHERIIFPVYVDFQVFGFVARDYTGKKQPKVLNSEGNFRSFSVWNFDNAKESEELVICEGTTSAVKCGVNRSIALLGKVATPGQIKLIRKMKAKKIYICLDVGTDHEVDKIYKSLAVFYPGKIHQVVLPPVIDCKVNISHNLCDLVNQHFKVTWSFKEETKLLTIPNGEKVAILSKLNISNKLPSDEKRDIFNKKIKDFSDFSEELIAQLNWILFESEYKDSGDYSHAEMDEFIKNSILIRGGLQL
jgi:hypothetical protein